MVSLNFWSLLPNPALVWSRRKRCQQKCRWRPRDPWRGQRAATPVWETSTGASTRVTTSWLMARVSVSEAASALPKEWAHGPSSSWSRQQALCNWGGGETWQQSSSSTELLKGILQCSRIACMDPSYGKRDPGQHVYLSSDTPTQGTLGFHSRHLM